MLKSRTHFEQIPVQKVKEAIVASAGVQENGSGTLSGPGPILRCRICRKPVPVETAKTDGEGQAIHEECYVIVVKPEAGFRPRPARL